MKKIDRSALIGIRQLVREIFRNRPSSEDVIEFLDMEDHVVITVTVKLWKIQNEEISLNRTN